MSKNYLRDRRKFNLMHIRINHILKKKNQFCKIKIIKKTPKKQEKLIRWVETCKCLTSYKPTEESKLFVIVLLKVNLGSSVRVSRFRCVFDETTLEACLRHVVFISK